MKKSKNVKKQSFVRVSPRHRMWGVLALFALFVCGLMVGLSFNGGTSTVTMSDTAPVVVVEPQPVVAPDMPVCARIEDLLLARIGPETSQETGQHLYNAYVYSTLAQKGCPEHTNSFKEMAVREIEIATALQDESEFDANETEIVIDAYKKMEMEAHARQFLDKIQRLTNPAIDFILQMEAIINEEQ